MKISEDLEIVRFRMQYRPLTKSFHFTVVESPGSTNMVTSYDSPYDVIREETDGYIYEWVVEPNGTQHFVGYMWVASEYEDYLPSSSLVEMPTVLRRIAHQFSNFAQEYFEEKLASAEEDFVNVTSILTHELAVELKEIRRVK
jgi:hypothetical protein